MNITSKAGASAKSSRDTMVPSVSGSRKAGAFDPRGSIVEGVSAMGGFLKRDEQSGRSNSPNSQAVQDTPEKPGVGSPPVPRHGGPSPRLSLFDRPTGA